MRTYAGSLLIVLMSVMPLCAQDAGTPPSEKLDTVLHAWEKATTELTSLVCILDRETIDNALKTKETYRGTAIFLRSTSKDDAPRFKLELVKRNDPETMQKLISDGSHLFEYVSASKVVRVHNMPKFNDARQKANALSLFGGAAPWCFFAMNADEMKSKFQIELVVPKAPGAAYDYIRIAPKLAEDKGAFSEVRLSLYQTNHMPAQIWYRQANGVEITWNFSTMHVNEPIPTSVFRPDTKGWRVEQVGR